MKWSIELLNRVNKGDLIEVCGLDLKKTEKKDVVVKEAYKVVRKDKDLGKLIYDKYSHLFALHPTKVEEILNITSTERKRWNDSRLKISYYDNFHKYGKYISYPMYDYDCIMSIKQKTIEKWRAQHEKEVSKNRKNGAKKAVETRKLNKEKVINFYEKEWIKMIESWKNVDLELSNTYQLAFWTMWLSRLAKSFQEKSYRSKKYSELYKAKKEECYKLKNEALELLSKSKYSKLSFYRPENPDKIWIEFCDNHYNDWCEERRYMYMDKWDFYYTHKDEIDKCSCCSVDINEDYYSLYYIELSSKEVPDYKFSFHTPYPIGNSFFGNPDDLEQVEHEENEEGLFRFGRSIDESEEVIFTEKRIMNYFNKSKIAYEEYLERKEKISLVK